MPQPYILDPFQRIIAFGRDLFSYAYRTSPCPTNQGGASYERQTTTIHTNIDGSQTSTVGPWVVYGGSCTPNISGVQLYLQGGGAETFGTSNLNTWNFNSSTGNGLAGGCNVTVHATGWKMPGLPNRWTSGSWAPVYYDVYINGALQLRTTRDTGDFYDINSNLDQVLVGAYFRLPGNVIPVMSMSSLYPVPNNSTRPGGELTLYRYGGPNSGYAGVYTIAPGQVYNFSCKITCPAVNFTGWVYNQMLWG